MLYEFIWSIFGMWFFLYHALWAQRIRIKQKYFIFKDNDNIYGFQTRLYAFNYLVCFILIAVFGLTYIYRFIVVINDIIHLILKTINFK